MRLNLFENSRPGNCGVLCTSEKHEHRQNTRAQGVNGSADTKKGFLV